MKTTRGTVLVLFLFVASAAYAAYVASPTVSITVKQRPGGRFVKQVTTNASGDFSLGALPAGAYVLEFRSPNPTDARNRQFSLWVAGTINTGTQNVAGNSLVTGVALDVEVGPNANVNGQITTGPTAAVRTRMIWIPAMLGSNFPGHWVWEDSAEAKLSRSRGIILAEHVRNMQDRSVNMGVGRGR
jgi:hypothetical protein